MDETRAPGGRLSTSADFVHSRTAPPANTAAVSFAGCMTDNRALLDMDEFPRVFRHQVAAATDLVALGLTSSAIRDRCRRGGPWQRLEPGLVLLADTPPSRVQRIQAALTVAGPAAVVSGLDALALLGAAQGGLDGPVHLLVPPHRQPGLVDGVYFERTIRPPTPLFRHGFPVAPLPRAVIDTCRRATTSDHVRTLLTDAVKRGAVGPAALREELDRAGKRGTALTRRVLAELDDGVRSVAQGWARRLVQTSGLPTPKWRAPITSPTGAYVATADAWWEVGLAWEVNSYAFDLSPADYAATLDRAAHLTASGIVVVHTPPVRLRDNPAEVADLLRAAYEQAASRPKPQVTAA
jgi:hypothetical protein